MTPRQASAPKPSVRKKKKGKTLQLNIFLLRSSVKKWEDAIEEKQMEGPINLSPSLGWSGAIYYRQNRQKNPSWKKDVLDQVSIDPVKLKGNASTSAVIFLKVKQRIMAVSFGGGRHLIKRDKVEPDFGVRVVVNTVAPAKIKAMSLKQFEEQLMKKSEEATKETSLDHFGVDKRTDIVSALSGIPENTDFALRVSGADALVLKQKFKPKEELFNIVKSALNAYGREPHEDFKWVLRIRPVSDPVEIKGFCERLVKDLKKKKISAVFSLPDDHSEDNCQEFHYGHIVLGDGEGELAIEHWLQLFPRPTIQDVKTKSIFVTLKNGETVPFRPLDVLAWEFEDKRKKEVIILTSGKWYRIRKHFVQEVDQFVGDAIKIRIDAVIPKADKVVGETAEEDYLDKFVQKNAGKAFKYHGAEKIKAQGDEVEACDVFLKDKTFIHAKIWHGSQSFSALMKQGENAAEILLKDEKYRGELRKSLGRLMKSRASVIPKTFAPSTFGVCFLLIRKAKRDIPFFSKLSLYRSGERIQNLGYRLAFRKVEVV